MNKTKYALGKVFLQEAYLVVDWERDVFELSQAVFSDPMPEPNIITIQPKNDTLHLHTSGGPSSNSGLTPATIGGLAVGAMLLLMSIAFGLWFSRRKRKQKNPKQLSKPVDII